MKINRREFLKASIVSLAAATAPKWAVALVDVVEAETKPSIAPSVPVVPVPVPEPADLATLLMENSIVRPRATIANMDRRHLQTPAMNDGQMRWLTMTARTMVSLTRAPESVTELELRPGFAQSIAWYEDHAFLFGCGIGQPLGVIRSPATVTVPRKWGHAVVWEDLARMAESFLPSDNGVWFISHSAAPDVLKALDELGEPSALLGFPAVLTTMQPGCGRRGDVVLADWRYYLVGDGGHTVERSDVAFWNLENEDEVSWRVVDRIDGRPYLVAPIEHNGRRSSPFVVLDGVSWEGSCVVKEDEAIWGMSDSDRLQRSHEAVGIRATELEVSGMSQEQACTMAITEVIG